jgi:hypothetical protein
MRIITIIVGLTLILCLTALSTFAQTNDSQLTGFEMGTVVLDNNTQLDVLIKVEKWNLSPTEVVIRQSEDASSEILKLEDVKSFYIPRFVKFLRDTIQYDISGMKKRTMLGKRDPFYEQRVVFLRVLVEGEASLYSYRTPIKEQFYFDKPDAELTHLVSKRYLASPNRIAINNRYQQQLYTELRCGDVEMSDMVRINYEIDDLTKYFLSYNKCKGSEAVSFHRVDSQGEINVYFSGGLGISNLTYSRRGASIINSREVKFGNIAHLLINAGIEWELPFNSKGWSLLGDLGYYTFSSEKEYSYGPTSTSRVTFETSILNIMAELRKYFGTKTDYSFFGGLAMGTSINNYKISGISYENTDRFTKQISLGFLWDDMVFGKVTYTLPYSIERIDLRTLGFSLGIRL